MTIDSFSATQCDSLPDFLKQAGSHIHDALMQHLPDQEPKTFLYDMMRDYPLRGGKRFRSSLLMLACEFFNGSPQKALTSAVAVETFQNFVLIHDDIEDGSLIRRGNPTLHRIHGVPLAINAGDSLMGLVYEVLAENEGILGPELSWKVLRYLAKVFRHTFEGQAMDIGWIVHEHFPSRAEYFQMIEKKTGWYSGRGPCQCGALIAGASDEHQEIIGAFGQAIGIGFQIRDDLLNLIAGEESESKEGYGKEYGGDIAEGKRTLITIELEQRLSDEGQQRLRAILLKPREAVTSDEIQWCIEQAHETGAIQAAKDYCLSCASEAQTHLDQLPDHPTKPLLAELITYLAVDREV